MSDETKLVVRVSSFSYKKGGIPEDNTDNGGGFVFDCRGIHNPGRYAPYKKLTGRDESVKKFLQEETVIDKWLESVWKTVEVSIKNYMSRGFENLMVSFGCTGGQHRSVYSADATAKWIEDKFKIETTVEHIEQEKKNWVN